MKKRHNWDLMFADPRKPSGTRTIAIPGYFIALCAVIVAVGLVGFGRLAYVGANYAYAIYDAHEQNRENRRLREQIYNLEHFINQKEEGIVKLAIYEDNARLKYGLEPISADIRKAGTGGFPSQDDMLFSSLRDPLIAKTESLRVKVNALSNQAHVQEQTFDQMAQHVQRVHSSLTTRPAIWPAQGRLTSKFGYRYHPLSGLRQMHEGIDIANAKWTPIYATANGQVRETSSHTAFGNLVKIDHGEEYMTLYAHMERIAVTQGQAVRRGDVIGYMGSTGRSTGSHLHYEVRHNGRLVNPLLYIVPEEQIVD